MTGLGVLNQWAASKAQQKAQKQQLKLLRQAARLQSAGLGSAAMTLDPRLTYANASNPMASITPSLGSTASLAQSLGGLTLPPIVPTLPGWTPEEGTGDLGRAWDWLTDTLGGDAPVATTTAVTTRRASPPRIVGAIDNATGKSFFYRYVGAPILFRGDLTTLKTAKRAVSKFGGLVRTGGTFRRKRRC
jgi:hypothetical protein